MGFKFKVVWVVFPVNFSLRDDQEKEQGGAQGLEACRGRGAVRRGYQLRRPHRHRGAGRLRHRVLQKTSQKNQCFSKGMISMPCLWPLDWVLQILKVDSDDEDEGPRKRPLEENEEAAAAPTKKKKKATKKSTKAGWSVSSVTDNSELDMSAWKNLFVPEPVLKALQEQGFAEPTKIQVFVRKLLKWQVIDKNFADPGSAVSHHGPERRFGRRRDRKWKNSSLRNSHRAQNFRLQRQNGQRLSHLKSCNLVFTCDFQVK